MDLRLSQMFTGSSLFGCFFFCHPESSALTFHLHLFGNLVDVVLRAAVGEHHQDVGDSPADSSLGREDVLPHVLDGPT